MHSRSRRYAFALGLAAALWPATLPAQDGSLEAGARVRVTRPGRSVLIGTVSRLSSDSLWLQQAQPARSVPIALAGSRIELSRGTRTRVLEGTLVGAAVGAVLTVGFLNAFCGGDNRCDGDEQLRAIAVFGLPPVALGAGVGLLIRREKWVEVGARGGGVLQIGLVLR